MKKSTKSLVTHRYGIRQIQDKTHAFYQLQCMLDYLTGVPTSILRCSGRCPK